MRCKDKKKLKIYFGGIWNYIQIPFDSVVDEKLAMTCKPRIHVTSSASHIKHVEMSMKLHIV